jgi:hypothetical protein
LVENYCAATSTKQVKIIIPAQFSFAYGFSGGLAPVAVGGHYRGNRINVHDQEFVSEAWGYIDKTGRRIMHLDGQADYAGSFRSGVAYIRLKDFRVGYIDMTGRYIWRPTR